MNKILTIILIVTISLVFSLTSCLHINEHNNILETMDPARNTDTESDLNEEKTDVYNNGVWVGKEGTYLSSDNYYQYSLLSDDEQAIYNKIVSSIQTMQNIVDVSEMEISSDDSFVLVDKVLADNPQFFWVSRHTSIQRNSDSGNAVFIVLRYTDGKATDVLNDDFTLISMADRNLINSKIDSFNSKIKEIVSHISSNALDVEKEKIIHDYIISNTNYDYSALNGSDKDVNPHARDIYGAIVEGKAVCEGYAKAFQYLCYCVGINATQVCGTSDGENHMWDAVKIDNEWYQIDLTWDDDDMSGAGVVYYGYFNLSDDEMGKDHIPNADRVSVPVCNGEKYEYADYYALNVTGNGKKSTNHQFVAQNLIQENGHYLIVSTKNITVTNELLGNIIYDRKSAINSCAKKLGVTFDFEYTYIILGDFIYIPLNIQKQ